MYTDVILKITDSGRCPYYHPLSMFGQAQGRWAGIGFWLVTRSWGLAPGHAHLECRYLGAQHRYAYVFNQFRRVASFIALMTDLPFVPIAEKSPGALSFRGVLPLAGAMAKYGYCASLVRPQHLVCDDIEVFRKVPAGANV